jgi:hypothetical protein
MRKDLILSLFKNLILNLFEKLIVDHGYQPIESYPSDYGLLDFIHHDPDSIDFSPDSYVSTLEYELTPGEDKIWVEWDWDEEKIEISNTLKELVENFSEEDLVNYGISGGWYRIAKELLEYTLERMEIY